MNNADIVRRMADRTGLSASAIYDGRGLDVLNIEAGRLRYDDDPVQRPAFPVRVKLDQRVDARLCPRLLPTWQNQQKRVAVLDGAR